MAMTYAELAAHIGQLSEEQQQQTATMYVPGDDEYFPIVVTVTNDTCDVLDENHIVLTSE